MAATGLNHPDHLGRGIRPVGLLAFRPVVQAFNRLSSSLGRQALPYLPLSGRFLVSLQAFIPSIGPSPAYYRL